MAASGETGVEDLIEQVLMVANPGGHLQQLHLLDSRLPFAEERLWVTADTPQSRSLLADRDAIYVEDVGSRHNGALARDQVPSAFLESSMAGAELLTVRAWRVEYRPGIPTLQSVR